MRVMGIQHHSVIVTDMARSRAFYRGALGLQEVPIPPAFDFGGAWFTLGEQQIHLLPAARADDRSDRHITLHVQDVAGARKHLAGLGAPVWEEAPMPEGERFFTADPDGNRIEILCSGRPRSDPSRTLAPEAPLERP